MPDSGFVEVKVDFSASNSIAAGKIIRSEFFRAGGHTWRVLHYSGGHDKDGNGDYLSLFLELVSRSKNVVRAIFNAFLVARDGQPSSSYVCMATYQPEGSLLWGWPQFVRRSNLEPSCYVVDGGVRIMCGVVVTGGGNPVPVPPPDIGVHLGRLLDCADATDVSFVVYGEVFPAHRAVLAARSPVFRAELLGSMAEASMACITLHEIEPVIFRVLLRFIYTDELHENGIELEGSLSSSPATATTTTTEMFQKLLAAADRYDLSRLKLMCARKLWETVSVDTVVTTLVYADMHGCPELRKRCLDFMADNNFDEVMLTERYLQLMQDFPWVIDEIRDLLVARMMLHL